MDITLHARAFNLSRRAVRIGLLSVGLFTGSIIGPVQAATIYAIGDSITRGKVFSFDSNDYPESAYRNGSGAPPNNLRSYREHLHDLLIEPSCDAAVTWVGSKQEGNRTPEFHEGRSGLRADEFLSRTWSDDIGVDGNNSIDEWLGIFAPDTIIIHLGTNDMQQGQSAESTRDDINGLLDIVYVERPNATIFLANVIPIYGWWANHVNAAPYPAADIGGEAQQLTALINTLVSTRASAGDDIHLIDVNSTFFVNQTNVTDCATGTPGDPANMSSSECKVLPDGSGEEADGIHPNLLGEKFIADQIFSVMAANTDICSGGGSGGDSVAPSVSIGSPASAGATLPSVATLSGDASDLGGSGFDIVQVAVENSAGDWLDFSTGSFSTGFQSTNASLSNTTTSSTSWSTSTPGLPDGSYTVHVKARDVAGNEPNSFTTRAFVVNSSTGGGGGPLYSEAEDGLIVGDMAIGSSSGASGGQFVQVPVGQGAGSFNNHYVEFSVTILNAGSYKVRAGVKGPNGSQNSFFAQIDSGTQYLWDFSGNNAYVEDYISNRGSGDVEETLSAGIHTLRVFRRETGAQLDWIEFEEQGGSVGDTSAPTVTISTPASSNATLPAVAALAGSASDTGDSGFDRVEVAVSDSAGDWLNFSNGSFGSVFLSVDATLTNTSLAATSWSANTPSLPDGNYTVHVKARDIAGNEAAVFTTRAFVVDTGTTGGGGPLYSEAEDGLLGGDMAVASGTGYSGGQYVRVPVGDGTGPAADHFVDFSVTIATAGNYKVLAGVKGPSGAQNSFFAQVDSGNQYLWDIPKNNLITTDYLSNRGSGDVEVTLSAGVHALRIWLREAGAQLDWIEFELQGGSSGDTVAPTSSIGTPASAGATLPSVATLSGSSSDAGGSGFDRVQVAVEDSSGAWLDFGTGSFQSAFISIDASLSGTTTASTNWSTTTPGLPDGNYTVHVKARDIAGNEASSFTMRTFGVNSGSGGGGPLYSEAEDGILSGDMTTASVSGASGGQVVLVPVGSGAGAATDHYVEFQATIVETGSYKVKAGVNAVSGTQNSFFAQIDGGELFTWDLPTGSVIVEDYISNRGFGDVEETLSAGIHTLRVYRRETGAQLDWIEFELQGGGSGSDTSDPTVAISSPASGTGTQPSVVSLAGTAADTGGSGVASVQLAIEDSVGDWLNFATGAFENTFQSTDASLTNAGTDSTNWSSSTPGLPDGSYTLNVRASDGAGNQPAAFTMRAVTVSTGSSSSLIFEAEAGQLVGDMAIVTDASASGGQYVAVPVGSGAGDFNNHYVEFTVTLAAAGDYKVKAGVKGPSGAQNSFWAQIDNGVQYLWSFSNSNTAVTDYISERGVGDVVENLSAGSHTLRVFVREPGAQLDWIEFELQ